MKDILQALKANGYQVQYGDDIELHAVQLHKGWEMDNDVWLVSIKHENGSHYKEAFTTSHGGLRELDMADLDNKIIETEVSLASLKWFKACWQKEIEHKERDGAKRKPSPSELLPRTSRKDVEDRPAIARWRELATGHSS